MSHMAYAWNIFMLCFVLFGPTQAAEYGKPCTLWLSTCDYEGGACDVTSETCQCGNETHVYSTKTWKCQLEVPLGAACNTDESCTTDGANCTDGICKCGEGFYDTRFPWLQLPGGQCLPMAQIGERCFTSNACGGDNSVCVNGICQCDERYILEKDSCIDMHELIPTIRKFWPLDDEPGSLSIFWRLNGPVTDSIVMYTDDPSQDLANWTTVVVPGNREKLTIDNLAEATYSFRITARTPDLKNYTSKVYKFPMTGPGCVPPLCTSLDGHCCCSPLNYVDDMECKQGLSWFRASKCVKWTRQYALGFNITESWLRPYKTSALNLLLYYCGFDDNQKRENTRNNRVYYTLTLYTPADADKVACYQIRLIPYVNKTLEESADDAENQIISADDFSGVVEFTGLVPGRPYDVTVASKLNCDDTNDVIVVNITAVTNPGVPGPISEESELDPAGAEITIKWAEPAVGEYTHFLYSMISVTSYAGVMYATSEPRVPEKTHYADDDDYGRKMDIEIRACTTFKKVTSCSEKFKTSVTTLGRLPKSLNHLECETTGPGSITVKWLPPNKRYGEYTNIEVHAVPAATALTVWLTSNKSSEALDKVLPVKSLKVSGSERSATLTDLPKDTLYAIFVYAVNNEGRSALPGSMDERTYGEAVYDARGDLFTDKLNMYMLHLTGGFYGGYYRSILPPVCSPVPVESIEHAVRRPKRFKVTKIGDGKISLSWRAPKKGKFLAGFRAKVIDLKRNCLAQYDFICTKGCLFELLNKTDFARQPAKMKGTFIRDFPEPDASCNHTTIEMSRDQMRQPIKFNITGLPSIVKIYVNLTTIGYIQPESSVVKKAKRPKKPKVQCAACVDPRNLEMVAEKACNSDAVYYFQRGRLLIDKDYPEMELKGSGKFLYRNREKRPKKYDKVLPGSTSTKCSCTLLNENPKYKMAFLKVDTSGLYYVIDYIVSLEREEIKKIEAKYKNTCWKR